jgi:cyclophilin family peptidyl-prolyl cis-trans isomerase/HEAT repeat protein
VVCALLLAPDFAMGQARIDSASVPSLRQAMFEAEDRRAPAEADLNVLRDATRHPAEAVQRQAIRALGRLERPALVGDIEPALSSAFASVRAAAAEALGQAAAGGGADAAAAVQAALLKRLRGERDPAVVGTICRTLGRLPYATAQAARSAEVTLLVAALPIDAPSGAPVALQLGVARGFESLIRRHARLFSPARESVRRLKQLALERRQPRRTEEAEDAARVRRLAMAALASSKQADEETITAASADPDGQVRRLALLALAATAPGAVPDAARVRVMTAGLADPAYLVRYEALRLHGRTLTAGSPDWSSVVTALSDPSPHVALLAIDLLGNPKAHPDAALERLRREAEALPQPEGGWPDGIQRSGTPTVPDWHRPAHALEALARIAPDEARPLLPRFAASAWWPVRMYAARAAAVVGDAAWLSRLARDDRDNVREAALAGLRSVSGHDADDRYLEALGRADYQLVMTAARALEGTPRRADAVPALAASLSRITAERRETSRDARLALLARISELGQASDAPVLLPYASDFDSRVAAEAAAVVGKWTGQTLAASPRPLQPAVPRLADIERLRGARAAVRITGRGSVEFTLLPDEAPATVARFVALARTGYYNGLTFHRVLPAFIVQGGSPGANEYVGDGPFMRDEIGLEPHVRGAVSISTRGRDTGDGQIWFDLVDNPFLDHDYTVFGRVTAGIEVLDRILECDVIERIDILPKGTGVDTLR